MEIGVERMLLRNDNSFAFGDIITRETGEINELTSQRHSGDNKKQAEETHHLEYPKEEASSMKIQDETIVGITNSNTVKFNKLDLTASTCIWM